MADFVESAKNFVSSAVSRTTWEAQKQLRVRGKQSEIDKLVEQRTQLTEELIQAAMSLYQQGLLHDAQLSRLCASIMELDHDLKTREDQLQELKNEAYPVNQFAPGPTTDYTPPAYNPSAGSTNASSSSSSQQTAAKPGTQSEFCPTCGNTVRPNALYCRSCGTKLR